MEKNLLLYNRYGTRVYLHWTFIVVAVCIIIGNAWPGNIDRLVWALLTVATLFVSVLLHESARALVAAWVGSKPATIILLPVGGVAGIQKFPDKPLKELAISVAGPVASLLIAYIASRFLFVQRFLPDILFPYGEGNKQYLLFLFYLINLALGIVSLIPSFPMDGGRILRSLLALRFNYVRATAMVHTFGRVIALLLLVTSILVKNFVPALAGLFIIATYPAEQSYAIIHSLVHGLTAGRVAVRKFYILPADMAVGDTDEILTETDNRYFVLEKNGVVSGAVSRMAVIAALAANRDKKRLSELPRKTLPHVEEDQSLDDLLETLAAHPEEIFTVLDNQSKIKGVISFRIVMEHLLLHNRHDKRYPVARSLSLLNA